MSYVRQPSPHVIRHAREASVTKIITPSDIATLMRQQDPFGLAHACDNPGGHVVIRSGENVVCFHCSTVFEPY